MKPLVSLDVFDTAIFRKVLYPQDIFTLIENSLGSNFKKRRIEAQDRARAQDIFYTLSDIYGYLPYYSIKEEIKTELLNCEANPYILDLYNKKENDYIFISDMYLPSSIIKAMLEKCGYENPYVFSSCEHRALKGNGALFRVAESTLQRKIEKHIGDNYQSDILGAKKAGIEEVEFIGSPLANRITLDENFDLKSPKLRKFLIKSDFNTDFSIEEKIGRIFAPIALAFTKDVLEKSGDLNKIFFNARDGFIFYIIARWILKTDKKIKYCRFSRRSCQIPNINVNLRIDSEKNVKSMNFLKTLRVESLRDFINTMELSVPKREPDFFKELNIDLDTPLRFNLRKMHIIEKFALHMQREIFNIARGSRINFLKYINNLNMQDGDTFVDLGHYGSMQSVIRRLTGINLKGMYFHKFSDRDYYENVHEDKSSFLPEGFLKLYTGIVELILSEPVGTVLKYDDEGLPILNNNDIKLRKEITKKILKGILKGVKEILEEDIEVPYEDCLIILKRFLENPTIEEATFGNLKLYENGSYKENESIVGYDKDLIRQGKLKECYNKSYWKPAFKLLLENDRDYRDLGRFIK